MGSGVIVVQGGSNLDELYGAEQVQDLKAIKNKQVFSIPIGGFWWDRPSPEATLGFLWLAQTVYPEYRGGRRSGGRDQGLLQGVLRLRSLRRRVRVVLLSVPLPWNGPGCCAEAAAPPGAQAAAGRGRRLRQAVELEMLVGRR